MGMATYSCRSREELRIECKKLISRYGELCQENLKLDIFLDKAVIEVFANKRQAICRRAYTTSPENVGMEIIANGGELKKVRGWDMMPSNMY